MAYIHRCSTSFFFAAQWFLRTSFLLLKHVEEVYTSQKMKSSQWPFRRMQRLPQFHLQIGHLIRSTASHSKHFHLIWLVCLVSKPFALLSSLLVCHMLSCDIECLYAFGGRTTDPIVITNGFQNCSLLTWFLSEQNLLCHQFHCLQL